MVTLRLQESRTAAASLILHRCCCCRQRGFMVATNRATTISRELGKWMVASVF
jgi:hypothetical protein